MAIEIRSFEIEDYDQVIQLWSACEGIGLSAADSRERIAAYLERNPGCSFTAWEDGRLVGAVVSGHDGRRGYLHHLAVDAGTRGRGIGQALANHCLDALARQDINKAHIFVYNTNANALAFWKHEGWQVRDHLMLMSIDLPQAAA